MTISSISALNPALLARAQQAEPASKPAAAGKTEASSATSGAFTDELETVAASQNDSPRATDMPKEIRPLVKHEARKVSPLEQFEGFVLRNFVETMLPSTEGEFFGQGTAGEIWRSMLAEEIGKEIAQGGGIGIADMIGEKKGLANQFEAERAARDGLSNLAARDDETLAAAAKTSGR
ncbi:rod-binding protein [Jiella marina]|uniref:rod-binding protein n=1 Tax=Jiella sp. LLJ827 TaxID=2917712 RepID=UPI002101A638|nr:rod-binding protein [Jiella sp. LLJ827]MCQ0988170.1 rod-binding protein [Jiella sp. LLJ827]